MVESQSYEKQRAWRRRPIVSIVWYSVVRVSRGDGHTTADLHGIARSSDLSERGVGIVVPQSLPVGERLLLALTNTKGAITVVGKIAHCSALNDGHHRVGGASRSCLPITSLHRENPGEWGMMVPPLRSQPAPCAPQLMAFRALHTSDD